MIKKIKQTFKEFLTTKIVYKTPGTPGFNIVKPKEDELITEKEQELYRSGVGSLLYLVKHSRPDLANIVRELAKCMNGATQGAFKELIRVIKFVTATSDYGLRIKPHMVTDTMWDLRVYTDGDWAGDKENRHSASGFIIYLLYVPIFWKSKLQCTVALSSTEAEYYALSKAAKEIKFMVQVDDITWYATSISNNCEG